MPDIPRQKLIEIVARFGPQVSEDAKRCEGLLRDYCNEHKREIVVLIAAISDGVTTELRGSQSGVPPNILIGRCAQRLQDNYGFMPQFARWGVETWALALGLCQLTDLVSKPKINLPNDSLAQPSNSSTDDRKDRFRQFVQEILSKGPVTEDDKVRVHKSRESLGISVVEARAIVGEVKAKLPPTNAASAACLTNSIGMKLVRIPKGTFTMGEGYEAHQVILTKPFYIGVYEVTQAQYEQVMSMNPSDFKGQENPVEMVSWDDAVEFCKRLSNLTEEKAAGRVYRLPTEAEWEYACRAGSKTAYSFGDDPDQLDEYGWYGKNSGGRNHAVGQKKPNAWGLYDMHGNVLEWCSDWYGVYPNGPVTDPVGPVEGSFRVVRGGSWGNGAANCKSSIRSRFYPANRSGRYGFRLSLSSPGIPK